MQTKKSFNYWQWRIIIGAMLGYSFYYFVRKNFSFAMPVLKETYGITNEDFGIVLTIVTLIYAISKFVNGIIADRANARWHLSIGLAVCVAVNFALGFSDKISAAISGQTGGPDFVGAMVVVLTVFMILNQLFQGCGAAPCNRLLQYWVPKKELATKSTVWNTAHSIGAFIASIMCGYIVKNADSWNISFAGQPVSSWQLCFWIPAIIAALGVILIIFAIRDTPSDVGLPELPKSDAEKQAEEDGESHSKFLMRMVFLNPIIWALAFCDFFVYIVRMPFLDWGPTFFKSMGMDSFQAGWIVGAFEIAGCLGMICAGYLTDKLFNGKSHRMCAIEMALVVLCMIGAYFTQSLDSKMPMICFIVLAGFFLYGPQALLGVVAFKQATKKAGATAVGLIGLVSYLSTVVTGWGLGKFSDAYGWNMIYLIMAGAAVLGFLIVVVLWNIKDVTPDEEK